MHPVHLKDVCNYAICGIKMVFKLLEATSSLYILYICHYIYYNNIITVNRPKYAGQNVCFYTLTLKYEKHFSFPPLSISVRFQLYGIRAEFRLIFMLHDRYGYN